MKNLVFAFVALFAFTLNIGNAQSLQKQVKNIEIATDQGDVEIIKDFKATKQQKRVISKVKKYVTPRIFDRNVNTTAYAGKTVKVQVNFDANGAVSDITMVDGQTPQLDEKVINLIKEYDSNTPFANTNIEKPSVIQLDIDLVGAKYFIN